jgi:glycosyltransferase involved in cell wall biosynthesis
MHVLICAPLASADVADLLPPDAELPVGYLGAPFIATLARALLDLGHRVSIVSTDNSLPVDCDQPMTATLGLLTVSYVPSRRYAKRFNGFYPGRIIDAFQLERRRMVAAIQALKPDVVHAHWSYEFAQAAIDSQLPRLVTCHDDPARIVRFAPRLYLVVRWLMARRVFATAGRFTTVSPYMRDQLAGRVNGPLVVIPNPLSPALQLQVQPALADPKILRIAMVTNFWSTLKNQKIAFKAHALVREADSSAILTCFGSDFGRNGAAEKWARSEGLADGVEFVGRLPSRELYRRLQSCQILVHTSLEESFGMVLAEAMALGLAVVAGSESAAVPWVVGVDGLLVDVRDPNAISAAVIELARNSARRHALSVSGHESVLKRFDAKAIAIAYVEQYLSCSNNVSH